MVFSQTDTKIKNFTITNIVDIEELQSQLIELEHIPTGARVIHIANDDPENLFCLSFQTLPDTSNGVAHILEHTVLCGSDKYPVKDPFFSMTRRSLNTYMNALTGSDFTCYPAASQVKKDFYNLLSVYLDAVFHPKLNELSFRQEGHRLEFEEPANPQSQLEYKGVVYNEMKGAMASPSSRLSEAIHTALLPDLTYGINSGGNPTDIPSLTYEGLKNFHQTFYHPSRCIFYFYGSFPLEEHLEYIEKNVLSNAEKHPPLPPLKSQTRFKKPIRKEIGYPIRPGTETKEKTQISFSWLTCHIHEQQEVLALNVLLILLMFSDASPLKHALLQSGLCKQARAYLDAEISEIPLFITVKGCMKDDSDKIESVIFNTLEDLAKKGISKELVDNAIHQLEFHKSEITGDHNPFGLSLYMRSVLLKHHGGKPEDGLVIHSLFNSLSSTLEKDPHYLESLLKKYLIDNPHFVRITMVPDPTLEQKEYEEELSRLKVIQNALSEKETQALLDQAKTLQKHQEEQDTLSHDILPKVTLQDVPKDTVDYLLTEETFGKVKVFHHSCFTNEIVYADIFFDLPELDEDDLFYARLLSIVFAQMGCAGRDYKENLNYIQAHTGGVGAAFSLNVQTDDTDSLSPSFFIHGKALYKKADKLFELLKGMLTSTDLTNKDRLKEILIKRFTSLQSNLTGSAMRYAMKKSASTLDNASRIGNSWFGIDFYSKLRSLVENIDTQIDELVNKLTNIQESLLCLDNSHIVLSCSKNMYDEFKSKNGYGLADIPTKSYKPFTAISKKETLNSSGYVIASPVAFTSQAFKTVPYIHEDTPALDVAAHLFDNLVLHQALREIGGAYGGGAVKNDLTGNFFFYAYRDPNLKSSLEAFKVAVDYIIKGQFSEQELQEAQLEVIQSLDSPISPGSRSHVAYLWMKEGKTKAIRQKYRDLLLNLTKEQVIEAVKTHIASKLTDATTICFAGQDLLESENKELKQKLNIVSI